MYWFSSLVFTVFVIFEGKAVFGCNEAVCASIVSKCMLTESCKCADFKQNRTCSRDCHYCLDYLYHDCCSCVQMCPKPNTTDPGPASKSHVEELPEPQQELFSVLTEQTDHLLRWTSYTMPMKLAYMEESVAANRSDTNTTDGVDTEKDIPVNCTVAFMSQCMSWTKCKASCTSMGASSYRWFHDKCCQCVGAYCLNYGINDSKCLQCPLTQEDDIYEHESTGDDYDFEDNTDADAVEEEDKTQKETKPEKSVKSEKQSTESPDKKATEDIKKSDTESDGNTH